MKTAISNKLCTDASLLKALTDSCYSLVSFIQDIPNKSQANAADAQIQLLITMIKHIIGDIEEAADQVMKL